MNADGQTTYQRILQLLADGEWHTEDELVELSYFPREWIKELKASGRRVATSDNGCLRVRIES
jgi:hypothetical protein